MKIPVPRCPSIRGYCDFSRQPLKFFRHKPQGRPMVKFMLLFLSLALTLAGQAPDSGIRAERVGQGPKIDGRLDDPAWRSAAVFVDFRQVEPHPEGGPSEKTELRILYDDANLYI